MQCLAFQTRGITAAANIMNPIYNNMSSPSDSVLWWLCVALLIETFGLIAHTLHFPTTCMLHVFHPYASCVTALDCPNRCLLYLSTAEQIAAGTVIICNNHGFVLCFGLCFGWQNIINAVCLQALLIATWLALLTQVSKTLGQRLTALQLRLLWRWCATLSSTCIRR